MAKQLARLEKEQSWRNLIKRQRQSGRSIRSFCAQESISEASFHWWRSELARRNARGGIQASSKRQRASRAAGPKFVPVAVAAPTPCPEIEIELRGGVVVRVLPGASRQLLCEVLAALEVSRC